MQAEGDDDVQFGINHRCSGVGHMTDPLRTSRSGDDDATLARAAAAGDRAAFAEIYDRYADRLHDFCVGMLRDRDAAADCVQDVFVTAATKLVQLREPERLRSWLYAIARSEALSRIRDRKREQLSEELPDMPSSEPDPATLAARGELADLIHEASRGLTDRDRVVLELAYRQGLDGPELADALGVTARNANTLVERLRDTIARSLGALLVCRRTTADPDRCPELAAILGQWDGELTVLLRKRVARHIDGCVVCEEDRARMITPAALLGATPIVVPAPGWLRQRTLDSAPIGGRPAGPEDDVSWWPPRDLEIDDLAEPTASPAPGRRPIRAGLAAALLLLGIGGAAVLALPAAFHVVPADSREPLTQSPTATVVPTTPSLVKRIAPGNTPALLPPPAVTTTSVVLAPSTDYPQEPQPTRAPAPTTRKPTTTVIAPVTTRPKPSPQPSDDEEPSPVVDPPDVLNPPTDEPPPVNTPKPTPPTKPPKPTGSRPSGTVPPKKVEPNCPPQDTTCNGVPVFS